MKIAFIGFGEAGRAFCRSLARAESGLSFAAYDIDPSAAMTQAMAAQGIQRAASSAEATAGAELIFSAVTADQSLEAARAAAGSLSAGQLFIDINSVSPQRKRDSAAVVETSGAHYIDMAVMAPVHPKGHATPVLIAGPRADSLAPVLEALGFSFSVVGGAVGAATAIKMVRSLFVKGLEAITVECLLAASASGCFEEIYASLSKSYPGLEWPRIADYHLERVTTHGKRRAAEMMESGVTLDELGLNGGLAREIAAVQLRMAGLRTQEEALAGKLEELLKTRLA
jgi:3-hydroxyisobutyrate dehydrogenase-like beta-hydroxyacid dehydrogenase